MTGVPLRNWPQDVALYGCSWTGLDAQSLESRQDADAVRMMVDPRRTLRELAGSRGSLFLLSRSLD